MTHPAIADARTVAIPRILPGAVVDGRCSDASYAVAPATRLVQSAPNARVKLVHSGRDLYVCATGLPGPGRRFVLRIDQQSQRLREPGRIGAYEFSITRAGTRRVRQLTGSGALLTMTAGAGDLGGAVHADRSGWSAELRIGIEWAGGYAHAGRLQITLETNGGRILQRFPAQSSAAEHASWALSTLGPVYARHTHAGSVFVSGHDGYVVIPYSRALSPRALTITAWVRAQDASCGTVVGNGQLRSYWLSACDRLLYSNGGGRAPLRGPNTLGDSWHHIAATQDADGQRHLYIDGVLDAAVIERPPAFRLGRPEHEREGPTPRIGLATGPVRIGADRDAASAEDRLRGYVREVSIWGRALSASEIRAFAMAPRLRAGILGFWRLAGTLRDEVAGRDAGLVGSASLARPVPIKRLPAPPAIRHPPIAAPAAVAPWNATIPYFDRRPRIDAECPAQEWNGAAQIRLEPNRSIVVAAQLTPDGLIFCTPPLFGHGAANALTIWLVGDAVDRVRSSAGSVRLRLGADGRLKSAVGDGRVYASRRIDGVLYRGQTGSVFGFQDDIDKVLAPWWSSELRIPLTALPGVRPGGRLRMGVSYDGAISQHAVDEVRPARHYSPAPKRRVRPAQLSAGRWPAALRPDQAATFADVMTEAAEHSLRAPLATPFVAAASAHSAALARAARTTTFAYGLFCPTLSTPAFVFAESSKWPSLGGARRTEGTLADDHTGIEWSGEDAPPIHTSHDIDMSLTPANADAYEVTIAGSSYQVLETESLSLPPNSQDFTQARPDLGDHVTVLGDWVFDCGHAPKTELHPVYALESDHDTFQTFPFGKVLPVRQAKVWFNDRPSPFADRFFPGEIPPLDFDLARPSIFGGHMPFLRVLSGDPAAITPLNPVGGNDFRVTHPPLTAAHPTSFSQAVTGYALTESPSPYGPKAFTVHLDEITVLDDGDNASCGEWYLTVNVGGAWRPVWWDKDACSGHTYGLGGSIVVVSEHPRIQVTAFEEDGLIDGGGSNMPSLIEPIPSTGSYQFHRKNDDGEYKLNFHVTSAPITSAFGGSQEWIDRFKDEPNDSSCFGCTGATAVTNLGSLHVTAAPSSKEHAARITEMGALVGGDTLFLGSDRDSYKLSLDDFSDVSVGGLPQNLTSATTALYPNTIGAGVPDCEKGVLGYRAIGLTVQSVNGAAGDQPYQLAITATRRALPGDWGEPLEQPTYTGATPPCSSTPAPGTTPGYRPVDLTAHTTGPPDDSAVVVEPWAWQHVSGDVDRYDVAFPLGAERRGRGTGTECDVFPQLELSAGGMKLSAGAKSAIGELAITRPDTMFANRHALVEVTHPADGRDAYQFVANWTQAHYYTRLQCDVKELKERGHDPFASVIPVRRLDIVTYDPADRSRRFSVDVYRDGGFRAMRFAGTSIDAVLSAPAGQALQGRLFDAHHVLIAETTVVADDQIGGSGVPAGLVPQARLRVAGLRPGATYALQLALGTGTNLPGANSPAAAIQTQVALSPAAP